MRTALVALAAIFFASSAIAQTGWIGGYGFTESGDKTAGGTAIVIEHSLEVVDNGEGLAVTLQSNGYQTSTDLVCRGKATGDKLEIFFDSYGSDNMFENYSNGDLLLTLEKKTVKGKEIVLTTWGKFTPAYPANQKSGKVYFIRNGVK